MEMQQSVRATLLVFNQVLMLCLVGAVCRCTSISLFAMEGITMRISTDIDDLIDPCP